MKPKVHILSRGLPRCRFSTKVPRDWPKGHKWVSDADADQATCQACLEEKKTVPSAEKLAVPWHCFECDTTVTVPAKIVTRDGGRWTEAPAGWLFVQDGSELTFVCSEKCIRAIYARND